MPAPVDTSLYQAKQKTRLETLIAAKKDHDYGPFQTKYLQPYDIAGDKQVAWIEDNGLTVVEAPRNQLYIQQVVQRLLACWPDQRPMIRVVITSDSAMVARAYAPGVVVFSAPLIAKLGSTDALAFTIAHELGHVMAEDEARRNSMTDTIEKVVNAVGSATMLARETRFRHVGNSFSIGQRAQFGSTNVLAASYGLDALAIDLITPNFEAQQEFDADAFALDMLVCAHFDPKLGSSAAIMTLSEGEALRTTHLERAALLAGKVIADAVAPIRSNDALSQIKNMAARAAFSAGMKAALKAASAAIDKRKGGEAREKAFEKYADKTYGGLQNLPGAFLKADPNIASVLTDPEWTALVANAAVVGEAQDQLALIGYDNLEKLTGASESNPSKGATPAAATTTAATATGTAAKPATDAKTQLAPLRARLTPDMRIAEGYHIAGVLDEAAADKPAMGGHWKTGINSPWASREMIEHLANYYVENGDLASAQSTLQSGQARMGHLPTFMPVQVLIYSKQNKPVEVEKTAAACLSKGGIQVYVQCVVPLGYDPACAPRTPEGKQALDAAKTGVSVNRLFEMPQMIDPETGEAQGRYLQCLTPANKGTFTMPKILGL